MTENMDNYHWF